MYIRCFLILAWSHMICKQHKVSHNILSAGPGPMRPRGHSNTRIENPKSIYHKIPKIPNPKSHIINA